MGVVFTRLEQKEYVVLSLFADHSALEKEGCLSETLDALAAAYGRGAVRFAAQGDGRILMNRERQSPHYTTQWNDIPKVSIR